MHTSILKLIYIHYELLHVSANHVYSTQIRYIKKYKMKL